MSELSTALQRARAIAGGNSELARRVGISSQAVSQWDRVPASRVLDVEKATGVRREELRPDLYAPAPAPSASRDPGFGHFSRFEHLRQTHFTSTEEVVEHIRALRDEWDRR